MVLLAQSSESLLLRKYKVFVHSQEMSYIYSKVDRKTGIFLSLNGLNYFVVIGMPTVTVTVTVTGPSV